MEPWLERIRGLRANVSTKSHAELDEAEELDEGNPIEVGNQYRELRAKFRLRYSPPFWHLDLNRERIGKLMVLSLILMLTEH